MYIFFYMYIFEVKLTIHIVLLWNSQKNNKKFFTYCLNKKMIYNFRNWFINKYIIIDTSSMYTKQFNNARVRLNRVLFFFSLFPKSFSINQYPVLIIISYTLTIDDCLIPLCYRSITLLNIDCCWIQINRIGNSS